MKIKKSSGRKKNCFGDLKYRCVTKDCNYMDECLVAMWDRKVARAMARPRKSARTKTS